MDATSMLNETGAVSAIARELGIDPATAQAGAAALMPSILSGFQSPAAAPGGGGLGGLLGALTGLGGGALLDNAAGPEPTQVDKGNEVLGHIFGSKDTSREVAAQAATQSGVAPELLKKMLPILAMVVGGYIMRRAGGGRLGGVLGGVLGSVLGGGGAQAATPGVGGGGGGGILGDLIGAAGKILGR